ncbi:MAG: amidohydrolase family protein [Caulobacterales bacterium]
MVVDVHTHVCPPRLDAPGDASAFWPCIAPEGPHKATITINGAVFRVIDERSWDGQRRLQDMENEGVWAQVLSPMPELLSYWLRVDEARRLADLVNKQILATAECDPARFKALGMVTAQDAAVAVRQLEALSRLGFCGIEMGSHVNGCPLGDPRHYPIYEAMEALGLALFVHPLHPCGCERIGGGGAFGAAALFPGEIALAAVSLIRGGVMERFPKLRILLSHGGGSLQIVLARLSVAWSLSGEIRNEVACQPDLYAKRFYYDSNVYDPRLIAALAERVGADRIAVGSDYPFLIRQERPGQFLHSVLPDAGAAASLWLSPTQQEESL